MVRLLIAVIFCISWSWPGGSLKVRSEPSLSDSGLKPTATTTASADAAIFLSLRINVAILLDDPESESHSQKTRPAPMLDDNLVRTGIERDRREPDERS